MTLGFSGSGNEEAKNGCILADAAMEVFLISGADDLSSLAFEACFGLFHDCGEGGSVNDGEVSEDFAVEIDVGEFKAFDEAGVGQTFAPDGSGNTLNPEAAELSLTLLTVTILVLTGFVDGILRVAIKLGTEAAEAFGTKEDALTAFPTGRTISCSWHCFFWVNGSLVSNSLR